MQMKLPNKKYFATFIVCGCVLLFGALLPIGDLWGIPVICTIVWIIFQIFKLRAHGDWNKFAVQISLLFMVYAIVSGIHWQRANEYRQTADDIAAKIVAYKTKHGVFPLQLKDIGEAENAQIHAIKYFLDIHSGEPNLYYKKTDRLFDEYIYHFATKSWIDTSTW